MNDTLLTTLETSKHYTRAVAEAMPENNYAFKPTGAGWNFGELIDHIAYSITWWEDNFVKGKKTDWNPSSPNKNKKRSLEQIEEAYAGLKSTLQKGKFSEEAAKGFHATIDHITHHRGQAVIYLRCNGIVPPEYTY
jgi:uncharacterized damage-inducible protein DinB